MLNSTGLAALDAYSINQAHPKMTREKRRAAVLAREAALRRLAFSHLHRPGMGVRTDFTYVEGSIVVIQVVQRREARYSLSARSSPVRIHWSMGV